jgi:hypothetical protein
VTPSHYNDSSADRGHGCTSHDGRTEPYSDSGQPASGRARRLSRQINHTTGVRDRTGRDGPGRVRTGKDEPGGAGTGQDEAGRPRAGQAGQGRARTGRDGLGRARTRRDGPGRVRPGKDEPGRGETGQDGQSFRELLLRPQSTNSSHFHVRNLFRRLHYYYYYHHQYYDAITQQCQHKILTGRRNRLRSVLSIWA